MPVPHQVADQPLVVRDRLGAPAVGDARGLGDGGVVAHVVDDADKAVVEDRMRGIEVPLHPLGGGAERGARVAPGLGDLGFLFGGERHGLVLREIESMTTISMARHVGTHDGRYGHGNVWQGCRAALPARAGRC